MKKLSIAANIIFLYIILLSNRRPGNGIQTNSMQVPANNNIQLGISPQLATDMVAEYRDKIWQTRKVKNLTGKDARSVWFPIEKLEAFLASIKSATAGKGCSVESGQLGVRIYYGIYPESITNWNTAYNGYFSSHLLPADYQGLHSVLMVPTMWDASTNYDTDFDPRFINGSGAGCSPVPLSKAIDSVLAGVNVPAFKAEISTCGVPGKPSVIKTAEVARGDAFMLAPTNQDNKKHRILLQRSMSAKVATAAPGSTQNVVLNSETSDPLISPTNGGHLIPPPPYINNGGTSIMKAMGTQEPSGTVPAQSKLKRKDLLTTDVPCSGALFMHWCDGFKGCGVQPNSFKAKKNVFGSTLLKPE